MSKAFVIAVSLCAITIPVSAQRLVPAQQVVNDFAVCAWQQGRTQAEAALATTIDTREERAALRSVARLSQCSDGPFISGRSGEFRGALATAAVLADARRIAMLAAHAGQQPDNSAVQAVITGGASTESRAFAASYGACVAIAAPANGLALIQTAVGSPEERAAMASFAPQLERCLPSDISFRLNLGDVRNHIADALYRISEQP